MGTKMAPNFANLFMADFEEKDVFNYHIQPLYYRRYIDDIFFIWPWSATDADLQLFQEHLNRAHPTIKFTFETSTTDLPYLDITIIREGTHCLIKPYFKTTNTFSYMWGTSSHPQSTFKGIVKGENTRILRNCTKPEDYTTTMEFLINKFKDRKFKSKYTNQPWIPFANRTKCLEGVPNEQGGTTKSIPYVSHYNKQFNIKNTLAMHWPIFSNNQSTRKLLLPRAPRISYRHASNIGQKLVRANLDDEITTNISIHQNPHFTKPTYPSKIIQCRHAQCGTCKQLTVRTYYYSYQTKKHYSINDIYSYDTTQAIYLLDCTVCGKQYVGETSTSIRS